MTPTRVVIVDDHPVFALGLARLLEEEPWCHVVGTAGDGAAAIDLVIRSRPDVAVVDLRLPDCNGVDLTRRLREALPALKVGILTMHADEEAVTRGMGAGANGYVLKDAPPEDVVDAIRQIAHGGIVISPGAADALRARFGTQAEIVGLTERDTELLRLVSSGLDNTRIAQRLYISPKTVRNRLSELYAKLGVRSRAEAVAYARDAAIE